MIGPFEIDIKKFLLVILILALPLISLNLEKKEADELRWYDYPVIWVVHPTQEFFTKLTLGVSDTTSHYINLLNIKKENRLLIEEVAKLKQDLKLNEEVILENSRLKNILGFKQNSGSVMIPAQVTAMGLWGEYSSLTLNKGSSDGLKKKMAVITHEGVVGYILNTTAHYSTVIVLTDRNAVIDSLIQKNRARGIVEGLGKDLCRIKYLQRTDDVQVNDLVVTSGMDNIFPKGFPIGLVTKVNRKPYGVTQYVEIRPTVDISRVEEVLVILKPETTKPENE